MVAHPLATASATRLMPTSSVLIVDSPGRMAPIAWIALDEAGFGRVADLGVADMFLEPSVVTGRRGFA